MNLKLDHTKVNFINGEIQISGSKSESNRLLVLQKIFPLIQIENLSNSDDTRVLINALNSTSDTIDIGHAGTAMRFLTAFFAIQEGKTTKLTGSKRMQERPIKLLVDALLDLGADISYVNKEGYPPIKIIGKKLTKNKVNIPGNVSSQYISALLLIAASLPNGLQINLVGEITSIPYINMTLSLLKKIGVKTSFKDNKIFVSPYSYRYRQGMPCLDNDLINVEPDWSSASYYYSLVALQPNSTIKLAGFNKESLQGDSILPEIYDKLGVNTIFNEKGIIISNSTDALLERLNQIDLNLSNTPDLAQTIAVTCLGLGIDCHLTGLHTLKIKETDRLVALKNELEKFGAIIKITDNSLRLKVPKSLQENCSIATYNDHRMAMAFAPLSIKTALQIENPEVVSKSYPNFWEVFDSLFI